MCFAGGGGIVHLPRARIFFFAMALLRCRFKANPSSMSDISAMLTPSYQVQKCGSAQELVETRILGGFLKNDKFGLGNCHALGLEQQIGEILVATTPSKKGFDVAVDGFHHPEGYFGAAVVEDAVEVIQQRESESLKGYQPLPAQLIDPTLQIAQHGSFIAVGPQPFQTFLQKVGLHHPSIQGEQLV